MDCIEQEEITKLSCICPFFNNWFLFAWNKIKSQEQFVERETTREKI